MGLFFLLIIINGVSCLFLLHLLETLGKSKV